jgi:hypothetical protein
MSRYHYDFDARDEYDRGRRDGDRWTSSHFPPSHEPEPYQDGYRDGHRQHEERREEERQEEERAERQATERRLEARRQKEAEEDQYYAQQQEQWPEPTVEELCGPGHEPDPDRPFPRCHCGKVIWLREATA